MVRCKEICQHPTTKNPGPEYHLLMEPSPTSVLRGFGSDKRFLEDPGNSRPLIGSGKKVVEDRKGNKIPTDKVQIVHSTAASIFSATYPYAEPPSIDTRTDEE